MIIWPFCTGRSGSGKSKVSALFRSCGIPVLDCDEIAREVTGLPACKKELALRFGSDLFLQNGSLDRRLLASRAFSSKENQGLDAIRTCLHNKTSVLSGPSGVGKSTLLNALFPDWQLETGAVSEKIGRGRHTTRFTQLLPLPDGIDTTCDGTYPVEVEWDDEFVYLTLSTGADQ